jgi:hypothetical protein
MRNTLKTAQAGRGLAGACLLGLVLSSGAVFVASLAADEKKAARKPTLEAALKDNAPAIRDFLWKKMAHPEKSLHVGVLKFLVRIGDGPASDNVGPLNLHLADRLEAALLLSLDDGPTNKIRILHNPSAVVTTTRADHLTEEGRAAFFPMRYPPAWGREKALSADAFLTGVVKIEDGGRSAEITVLAFDKKGGKLVEVCPKFKVAGDASLLTEAGVSFALPRGKDADRVAAAWEGRDEVPAEATTSVPSKGRKAASPAELLDQAPVELQILYNGKPMEVSDDGRVREPNKNDKVTFRLRHKNLDENTYGVVLKVNGENTIKRDNLEADDYLQYKWILKPKARFPIQGFQMESAKEACAFEVLPLAESRERDVSYGPHAGTFTLVVFKGRRDGKESRLARSEDDTPVIGRGVPNRLAGSISLKSLQGQLRTQTQSGGQVMDRGLIVPGKQINQEVEYVEFKTYRNPLSVIHIRYYKPRDK